MGNYLEVQMVSMQIVNSEVEPAQVTVNTLIEILVEKQVNSPIILDLLSMLRRDKRVLGKDVNPILGGLQFISFTITQEEATKRGITNG